MEDFTADCRLFLQYLQVERGASHRTLEEYGRDLAQFAAYLKERGLSHLTLHHSHLRAYLSLLYRRGYNKSTVSRKLSCLRSFYAFLEREGTCTSPAIQEISSPKGEKRLPRFLYPNEVEAMLAAATGTDPLAVRDRAILETLYASGVRVSELVGLSVSDVDLVQGVARVLGKGRKERYVLLGRFSVAALKRYVHEARPQLLAKGGEEEALFLNRFGTRLTDRSVRRLVDKYVEKAALSLNVSPHTFRHTFATHLLNGGADLRVVQELLGHAHLSTTQVYTHTTKEQLRRVYMGTHPRA